MRPPRGPDEHKAAARQLILREPGKRPRPPAVDQLLALSADNDPYYSGRDSHRLMAEWFAGIWADHGGRGAHLRHVHYRAFTAGAAMLDGSRYANDERTWKALGQAAAHARYLGLVDPEELRDQRNDRPRIGAEPRSEDSQPWAQTDAEDWEPSLPSLTARLPVMEAEIPALTTETEDGRVELPGIETGGYAYEPADQPVMVEVWSEKSSVDDTMIPLCDQLHVNYVPGTGYLSVTRIVELLRRAEAYGKPAHVLYVSDLDDAGRNMPRQVARQAQFWADTLGIDAEMTLQPLALTDAQVAAYKLPPAPDTGAVELDALIALHPGELQRIIRAAIAEWRDPAIRAQLGEAWGDATSEAGRQWDETTDELAGDAADLLDRADEVISARRRQLDEIAGQARQAARPLRARLDALVREINEAVTPFRQQADAVIAEAAAEVERIQADLDALRERYSEIAETFDPDLPGRPEAECTADHDGLLYDSTRDWLDQLNHFRRSKGMEPLADCSSEAGPGTEWAGMFDQLIGGDEPVDAGDLTNQDRRQLVAALAETGWTVARIVTATGMSRSTVSSYWPAGLARQAQVICQGCGQEFTGRSNAQYCNRHCGRRARGD